MMCGQMLQNELPLFIKKENVCGPKIQTFLEEGPANGFCDDSVLLVDDINHHCQVCRHGPTSPRIETDGGRLVRANQSILRKILVDANPGIQGRSSVIGT
jgi:hypothetical protein